MIAGLRRPDGGTEIVAAGTAGAGRPMTEETPYFLASITKMYTAATVMKLVADGRLELDAAISTYLDDRLLDGLHVIDGVNYAGRIRVTQLLDQTSGLADYFEGSIKGGTSVADDLMAGRDRSLSVEQMLAIARQLPPRFAPGAGGGSKAHYSDTNYALLGEIIRRVSERSVAANFDTFIIEPLGLTATYVFDHTVNQPTPAAIFFKDDPVELPLAMSSFAPDGGVVATAADSLRFLAAFFGGELLTADELGYLTRRFNRIFFPLRYGAGVMRFALPRWLSPFKAAPELIGHSGSTGSFAFFNPQRNVYIAGTVNQLADPGLAYRLALRLPGLVKPG